MLSLGLYKRKMGQKGNTITQDFHLEIETSFFPQNNKEINGWSLLNGIRKINNLRLLFLIVFFLGINQFSIAQEDWKEVKVEQIISVNRFVIKEISTEKVYEIQISKTKPISQSDSLYKEGIAFLKEKVLGKNLFFIFSNRKDNILEGSILYECERNKDYPNNGLPPCLSATPLDYTLIKKGYVKNLGNKTVSIENPE